MEVAELKTKYAPKLQTLIDQVRRAEERVEREKAQAGQAKFQTVLNVGATLLGAFLGRRMASVGAIGRAASAARSAGRIGKEQNDMARASESVQVLQNRLAALEQQFEQETAALQDRLEPAGAEIRKTQIRPRKSDITVGAVGLCWSPWKTAADGMLEPL